MQQEQIESLHADLPDKEVVLTFVFWDLFFALAISSRQALI